MDLNYLGHKFNKVISDRYKDDYICEVCSIHLYDELNEATGHFKFGGLFVVVFSGTNNSSGIVDFTEIYELTCSEQLIKNILE